MFDKKIKDLQEKRKLRQIELDNVHEITSDPMLSEMYKNDLMVEIMHLDNEVDFEKSMKPFRYAILVFIVASTAMLLYAIAKKYL